LGEALERLRKNHYPLWKVMVEVREDPAVVEEWRQAPSGSVGHRKLRQHAAALEVLRASTSD
jgi:hypothetical protein